MSNLKIQSTEQLNRKRRVIVFILLFLFLAIQFVIKYVLSFFELNNLMIVIDEVIKYTLVILVLSIVLNFLIEVKKSGFFTNRSLKKSLKFLRIKKDLNNTFINRDIYNTLKSSVDEKFKIAQIPKIKLIDEHTIKIENLPGVTDKLSKFKNDLSSTLKDGLVCETYKLDKSQNYYVAKLIDMSSQNRMIIKSVDEYVELLKQFESYQIPFNKNYFYDMSKAPHMLISGVTGSGKSYMLYHIIFSIIARRSDLYIIDRKKDIAKIDKVKSNVESNLKVASEIEDIKELVDEVLEIMTERESKAELHKSDQFSTDFKDLNFKPLFIVFDELSATVSELESKEQKELMKKLKTIVQRGRSAGICLIIAMQSAKADTLDSSIRSQLNFKCVLGNSTKDTLHLLFTAEDVQDIDFEKGEGYFTDVAKRNTPSILFVPTFEFKLNLNSLNKLIELTAANEQDKVSVNDSAEKRA